MMNLISGGFPGKVIPVNPKRTEVLGLPCFPTVADVKEPIDLAVIVVPAPHVLEVMKTCVQAHVKAVIVIAAGFKESGSGGLELENAVVEVARSGGVRMIGPNCLGIMNPSYGLNASFGKGMPHVGSIAFISQSGAMCAAVLDRSLSDGIGFSAFVSIGSMADVGWSDLIEYFGQDPKTRGILMYMETVGNPRGFLTAARSVAEYKPIIVIKPGRTAEAAKAAASHTGALVGSDSVFDAACERSGVVRVDTVSELFDIAEVLSFQPNPSGPRLAIVTNAGGPAVLATDAVMRHGAQMAKLNQTTLDHLSSFLPPAWSHSNPVDILGDADPQRYEKAVETVVEDNEVDGVLVILTPQDMTDPTKTAEELQRFAVPAEKPLIASWMGGKSVEKGKEIFASVGIPCFEYPDDAAWSLATMWKHANMMKTFWIPPRFRQCPSQAVVKERMAKAHEVIHTAVLENRLLLTERESKQILQMYGIPTVEPILAKTEADAAAIAERLGFPVVLKVESPSITHKSDVGGVLLRLMTKEAVREGFLSIQRTVVEGYGKEAFLGVTVQKMVEQKGIELIVGSSIDPQFGPVLLFGAGGIYVEAFHDEALGLPPLNAQLARRMIEKTKISRALQHTRGSGTIPLEPIEDLLISLSELVLEVPQIAECDMNPIIATSSGPVCLDARIVLSRPDVYVTPACRPYPFEYIKDVLLADGKECSLRPIRAEDSTLIPSFYEHLASVPLFEQRLTEDELVRLCWSEFGRQKGIVAECHDGARELAGICLLQELASGEAQMWMAMREECVSQGLPQLFTDHVLSISISEHIRVIRTSKLGESLCLRQCLESCGFIEDRDQNMVWFAK
jgi:acetyltransferase